MEFRQLEPIFILLLVFNSCTAQNKSTISTEQLSHFEKEMILLKEKHLIPGMAIAISSHDSLVYSKGLGFSDLAEKVKVIPSTPFRIASLTKPIASTILMKLVEENNLQLDSKIKDFYPDYLGTCKRILNYFNSELPEYSFLLDAYEPNRNDITIAHHLSHTAEKIPGDEYKYNGFLFGMLSKVMETATQTKFDVLVDSLIIKKLNLKQSLASQLDTTNPNLLTSLAKPYHVNGESAYMLSEFPNPELNAGAGMISSVEDLIKFDNAIDQNILITKESKLKQFGPNILNDGSISPYALGWFSQNYKGYTLVWHYGWQPNAYSGLYLKVLEKDMTLILLANSEGLSNSFNLGKGEVLSSEFAKSFLELVSSH